MQSDSRRRWRIAIASVSVLTLGLTACGGGGSSQSSTPSVDESAAQSAPGEVVNLDFIHRLPDGEGMTKVADTVARWNKEHPDIQVKSTKFDGAANELITRLETDQKAGKAPCVAFTGYTEVPELYVKGMLEDVSTQAEKYKANYVEGAYNLMSVGGVMTGLPQDVGPLVYYYDKAAFDELGLKVPTDLESFQETARQAKAKNKYISAFSADEAANWLPAQAAAAGDEWFTSQDNQWVVNTVGEGSQKVADFWQTMLDENTTLVMERWGDGFTKALVDGQLIGHIGAGWEAGFLLDPLDGTKQEGTWRVAQLPDFGKGAVTGPDGGSGLSVMKGCKYPDQAMEFIDWFNNQTDDLATQGTITATTKTVATPEKIAKQFGGQDVMAEMRTASANLATNFTFAPGYSTMRAMNQTAANVGVGKGKVMDIFATGQKTMVDTLKNLNLPVKEG